MMSELFGAMMDLGKQALSSLLSNKGGKGELSADQKLDLEDIADEKNRIKTANPDGYKDDAQYKNLEAMERYIKNGGTSSGYNERRKTDIYGNKRQQNKGTTSKKNNMNNNYDYVPNNNSNPIKLLDGNWA